MSHELPYYKAHAKDLLTCAAYQLMDDTQKACFRDLRDWNWANDGLPTDPAAIARLLGREPHHFVAHVWPGMADLFEVVEVRGRKVLFERTLYAQYLEVTSKPSRAEINRNNVEKRWEKERSKTPSRRRKTESESPETPDFTSEDTNHTIVSHARARASESGSDSGFESESGSTSSPDEVSPAAAGEGQSDLVALQTSIDEPDPEPDQTAARRLGRLMAEIRARGAGLIRVQTRDVRAYGQVFARLLQAGFTAPNLELMLRWFESTPEGRKVLQYNLDNLPGKGREHPLETNAASWIRRARAWGASSPAGDLTAAAGAEVVDLGLAAPPPEGSDLEAWWARARDQLLNGVNDPDRVAEVLDPLALTSAEVLRDGTLAVVVSAPDWPAYQAAMSNRTPISYALEQTAPGPPERVQVAIQLSAEAEESEVMTR